MNPTFSNHSRPLVTSMILKDNPDSIRYAIKNSIYEGADAIAVQTECIKREFRTEENYKMIFAAAAGRPIYVTSYRDALSKEMTYEECAENLLLAMKCGGTLADVPASYYDLELGIGIDLELSMKDEAVSKQMALIDKLHKMGKEVIMSSHVLKFTPVETVLMIASEQVKRGADIVKIVTASNSDEEEMENFRIASLLKKEISVPYIYLAGGTHSKRLRMVGPQLGCFGYFAVLEHDERAVPTQPTVKAAKAVRDNFDYMPDVIY